MTQILWDASALAKRYVQETGTETVNAIFQAVPRAKMMLTPWGYTETYFILVRRQNAGTLSAETFSASAAQLRSETLEEPGFAFVTISDALIFGSLSLIRSHSLNSADAAILTAYLRYARTCGEACLLVAADQRLLRAASAEGLATLNPEAVSAADALTFLPTL